MPKNFCLAITLMVTVLFIFGCGQQEKTEMEQHVSERRETVPENTPDMKEHVGHTPTEKSEMTSEDMSGMNEHADHASMVASSDAAKTIRYWTCVMHPTVKMPEPGSCPVCKMDLIPIYEGSGLELTEQQKALIPVRTEPVAFREVSREIRTVGVLDYNETRMAYASTRISGWIEDLHIDFTGINVREGDELLSIYSPELVTAQEEYLTALKSIEELQNTEYVELRRSVEQTVTAAKSKLELYGLTLNQIEDIRDRGEVSTTLPLFAPIAGTVVHMNVTQGQHVNKGMNLYHIADLNSLWIMADVYEYELPWIYMGQAVEITAQSMPGLTFSGKVTYIYPFFDTQTRTQKVQIEVPNLTGRLRPGMYVTLQIKPTLAEIYTQGAISKAPYACPMHPWATSEHPDECEICGMDLEPTHSNIIASEAEGKWVCPMHPEEQSDEFGECSICGMDLVERAEASTPTETAASTWVCPMHPEEQSDEFGECSICGMDLVEKQSITVDAHSHAHQHAPSPSVYADQPPLIFKYVCPDHPDEYATVPGLCPHDGKPLHMTGEVLTVPKSAVIDTGLRKIVFVDRGESGYEQIEVKVGPEAWGISNDSETKRRYYPIVSGLTPGDMVVTHGNFLIDSQTQLTGSASGAYGGALGGEEESKPPVHQH
ncbi:MAG: efflux RND transporter periplasmic adaptor subunit [Candidatus Poribacteria bacterium]|nr:efflux RND transporter periplasmic adaptor subunit [Candidatus Poribacteria bacterium]